MENQILENLQWKVVSQEHFSEITLNQNTCRD